MNELKYLAEYLLTENSQYTDHDLIDMLKQYYSKSGKKDFDKVAIAQMDRSQLIKTLYSAFEDNTKVKTAREEKKPEDELLAIIGNEINTLEQRDHSDHKESDDYEEATPVAQDVSPAKWPTYAEFRRKYYKLTCDKGWPKEIIPETRNPLRMGNIRLPWQDASHTAYVFNSRGIGMMSLTNYTKKVKDYLYNEFKDNSRGIHDLLSVVEDALTREQLYFKGRAIRNAIGGLIGLAFRGLGFNDKDAAIVNYIKSKIRGMTIFEYQKMILTEMDMKMSLSDTTVIDLKNILYPLRNQIASKMDGYNPTKITPEYRPNLGYVCSFKIESTKQDRSVFPGQAMMDFIDTICKPLSNGSLSNKEFNSKPSTEELSRILKQLEALKAKGEKGEMIARSIGQFIQYKSEKYNRSTDELEGEYTIRVRYQPFRAIVEVVYKPNNILKREQGESKNAK